MIDTETGVGESGYLDLCHSILKSGTDRGDRTGTGTRSIFHSSLVFDLRERFPLLTTKKIATKACFGELLWFINGDSNLSSLRKFTFGDRNDERKTIWDANIDAYSKSGDGGFLYGEQWRCFSGANFLGEYQSTDQIKNLLEEARENPESRRLLVNAWNAAEIQNKEMALPPCHFAFQVYIEGGYLNLKWNQRSVDVFLGLPFNIASYATLTHLLAHWLDLKPGFLVGDLTNVHIYHNHFDAVRKQLSRDVVDCDTKLWIPYGITLDNLENYTADDFVIEDYESHPTIKAPMAV